MRAAVGFYGRQVPHFIRAASGTRPKVGHEPVRGRDRVGSCDGVRRTGSRLGERPSAPWRGSVRSKDWYPKSGARRPRAVTTSTCLDINNGRAKFQRSTGPHPRSEQPKQHSALKFSQSFFDSALLRARPPGRLATRPPRGLRDRTPAPSPPTYAVAPSVGPEATAARGEQVGRRNPRPAMGAHRPYPEGTRPGATRVII